MVTVTATASGAGSANGLLLAVRVLTNASRTQPGTVTASESLTVPQQAIVPSAANNWVYGTVGTGAAATAFSSPSGSITSVYNQTVPSGSRWGGYHSGLTTTSSTTYGWALPTEPSGDYYIAQAEIKFTGTPSEDVSTPVIATTTTAKTLTTVAFTPPASDVLVAMVNAQWTGSGIVTIALSDSASAYTWTQASATGTTALCSVWIGIPKSNTSTGSLATKTSGFGGTGSVTRNASGSLATVTSGFGGAVLVTRNSSGSLGTKASAFGGTVTNHHNITSTGSFGTKPSGFGGTSSVTRNSSGTLGTKASAFGGTAQVARRATGGLGTKPSAFGGTGSVRRNSSGSFGTKPSGFGGTAATNIHISSTGTFASQVSSRHGTASSASTDIRTALHLSGTLTDSNLLGGTLTKADLGGSLVVIDSLGGSVSQVSLGGTLLAIDPQLGGMLVTIDPVDSTLVEWTMQEVDISLAEFNDETLNLAVTSSGTALNITGCSLDMFLKPSAGVPDTGSGVLKLSTTTGEITVTSAVNGLATVAIPSTDLTSITAYTFYRVDVVNASSKRNTAIFGKVSTAAL